MIPELTKQKLEQLVIDLGEYALSRLESLSIKKKDSTEFDIATDVDTYIEKKLREFIKQNFPEHSIIGEELDDHISESEFKWLIDPIDGTKFYASNIPLWTITLALQKNNETVYGVIYNPSSKQLYQSEKGSGAFLNGKKLKLNSNLAAKESQISYDMTFKNATRSQIFEPMMKEFAELSEKYHRVRLLGSGSLSLAWVAQGFFQGYICPFRAKDTFMDIAAGILITQEAGARVKITSIDESLERIEVSIPLLRGD